jgi:hypothetical protein
MAIVTAWQIRISEYLFGRWDVIAEEFDNDPLSRAYSETRLKESRSSEQGGP